MLRISRTASGHRPAAERSGSARLRQL